jgi:hypothetical protein
MADVDISRVLEQSMNDEYQRITSGNVSTKEGKNVSKIFKYITIKKECIVCYDENVKCAKCFQCTALYCEDCLTKIASDTDKCICGINIKTNYNKLIKYNEELNKKVQTKPARPPPPRQNSVLNNITNKISNKISNSRVNANPRVNTNNNAVNSVINDLANFDIYNDYDYYDTSPDEFHINEDDIIDSNSNNNSNSIGNNYSDYDSWQSVGANIYDYVSDENIDSQLNLIDGLKNNNIYNINYRTYKSNSNTNNFKHEWNHSARTLTFKPFNSKNIPIVMKYKIFNSDFQAELYPWMLEILNDTSEKTTEKWNKIAKKINTNKDKSNNNKLIEDIIEICYQ